jgi:hypothetical protein
LVPFGRTPEPGSDALVIIVPGSIPRPPIPDVRTAQDYETPEGRLLLAKARELASQHPDRLPLRGAYTVAITYRTTTPMTSDQFIFMVDVVSYALSEAGVIEHEAVYDASDFEIDRELGDAYSLEIFTYAPRRDAELTT